MKKHLPLLLALALCLACAVPAPAAKPHAPAKKAPAQETTADTVEVPGKVIKEPNAFHGVKWGTPMAAVPDLAVVEKDGQAAYATASDVVYRIGDAFLTNVVYGFCQDKFAAVMVEYKGRRAHESIRKFLTAKYTAPIEVEGKSDSLGWPIGNVLIRMEFSAPNDAGTLSYFYQPLFAPCGEQGGAAK